MPGLKLPPVMSCIWREEVLDCLVLCLLAITHKKNFEKLLSPLVVHASSSVHIIKPPLHIKT